MITSLHSVPIILEDLVQSQPRELIEHSRSVARLASDLSQAAGCPADEQERIRAGSLLHDIGKQFIPRSVLEKKGALSAAEFNRVQQHPWSGYVYLNHFVSDATILNTVLYHHERWNGTGYPNGLEQEEIPLGARICALADVWDALVSERCYRNAWSTTQAADLIWAGAGSLFDPYLAFQFLTMIEAQYKSGRAAGVQDAPVLPIAGRNAPALERVTMTGLHGGIPTP